MTPFAAPVLPDVKQMAATFPDAVPSSNGVPSHAAIDLL